MSRARDNADLGDSYGVLGAGVTGGSGLTALGTVTSGVLNSGVTGGTGLTGVVTAYGTDSITGGTFNSASYTATGASVTLTRTAGTKVIAMFMGGTIYIGGTEVYTTIFRASVDLGKTSGSAGGTGSGSGLQRLAINYIPHSICVLDTDTSISGSTVYEVYAKNTTSASWEILHNNWSGAANLIVMGVR